MTQSVKNLVGDLRVCRSESVNNRMERNTYLIVYIYRRFSNESAIRTLLMESGRVRERESGRNGVMWNKCGQILKGKSRSIIDGE